MTALQDQLAAAQDQVERINRQIAAADCALAGCTMVHVGGMNAGCGARDCCCSVPVHACPKCGDSDYGDNAEAAEKRAACAARGPEDWTL